VSVQDRCSVCNTHPMVLLGDEAQVETQKSFWTHQIELLGDMGLVESRFGPLGDSASGGA
jgi:hypothetical protein